ncbi:MAG: hypothetical protein EXQ53_07860 [Acidobacteria bacterium]|nr:hypothetical protein [Acidobacteriota bacterium]
MAVPIQPGPGFIAGNPQVVVDGPFATILPGIPGRMYDVSRDWFEELRRLAPVENIRARERSAQASACASVRTSGRAISRLALLATSPPVEEDDNR